MEIINNRNVVGPSRSAGGHLVSAETDDLAVERIAAAIAAAAHLGGAVESYPSPDDDRRVFGVRSPTGGLLAIGLATEEDVALRLSRWGLIAESAGNPLLN